MRVERAFMALIVGWWDVEKC